MNKSLFHERKLILIVINQVCIAFSFELFFHQIVIYEFHTYAKPEIVKFLILFFETLLGYFDFCKLKFSQWYGIN